MVWLEIDIFYPVVLQKVFWVGVVEEILQLISGSTYPRVNPKETFVEDYILFVYSYSFFQEKGINHIWESDEAKEYLDR